MRNGSNNPYLEQENNSIFNDINTGATWIFLSKWGTNPSYKSSGHYVSIYGQNPDGNRDSIGICKGFSTNYRNNTIFTDNWAPGGAYSESIKDKNGNIITNHDEYYAIYVISTSNWASKSVKFKIDKVSLTSSTYGSSMRTMTASKGRLGSWHNTRTDIIFEGNIVLALMWNRRLNNNDIEDIENLIENEFFTEKIKLFNSNIKTNQKNIDR